MPKSIRYTARLVVLVALAATLAMWHALASPRHSPYWSALSDLVAAPAFAAGCPNKACNRGIDCYSQAGYKCEVRGRAVEGPGDALGDD